MAEIYHLNLNSLNFFWHIQSLEANRELLERHGIVIPPFHETEPFPRHSSFWNGKASCADCDELGKIVAAGKIPLLVSTFLTVQQWESMEGWIKNCLPDDVHATTWSIFGRPALLYENLYKNVPNRTATAAQNANIKNLLLEWPTLAEKMLAASARNEVLVDETELVNQENAEKLMAALMEKWGVAEKAASAAPRLSRFFINSPQVKGLADSLAVRGNTWPRFTNEGNVAKALVAFDAQAEFTPYAPAGIRRELLADTELAKACEKLAAICRQPIEKLEAPAWFRNVAEDHFTAKPAPEFAEQFIPLLDAENKAVLLRRLENDQRYLDEFQKKLLTALQKEAGAFSHLGEPENKPLLTVLTMTCNHEKYIAECMESVLQQKTSFPVRHLVLDHYSRDGTAAIVNEYASRYPSIRPILLDQSQPGRSNVIELLDRCDTTYAALCDGDDYFIDENKLQLQVDWLEAHPSASMVFHPVLVTFEDGTRPAIFPGVADLPNHKLQERYYLSSLTKSNFIQTNSVVYRWRFPDGLPDWFVSDVCPGDWYWHILHAEKGPIGFIKKIMSVYRRHAGAIYADSFKDSVTHRKKWGLAELNAYKTYNDHLKGLYFRNFATKAAAVFTDFALLADRENDTTLLDLAAFRFPDFAKHFFTNYLDKIQADEENNESGEEKPKRDKTI